MNLRHRCSLFVAVVALAGALQALAYQHVSTVERCGSSGLDRDLARFPHDLGGWRGRDVPVDNPRALYGDESLNRTYVDPKRGQSLSLWISFSKTGEDRLHHPEVCLGASGHQEDRRSRTALAVGTRPQPVQKFRWISQARGSQVVFYWHYTLPPGNGRQELTWLQRRYAAGRQRSASLTVEVFAPELSPGDALAAEDFVRTVDAALQAHFPPGAVRGSDRAAYLLIDEGEFRTTK